MYDNAEYANSRLAETIILLDCEPVYVVSVRDGFPNGIVVEYMRFEDGRLNHRDVHNAPLGSFCVKPVRLGYLNIENKPPAYFARKPMRKDWRQGLRNNSLASISGFILEDLGQLKDTIMGKYPNIDELIKKRSPHGAWSRDWCYMYGKDLCYKGEKVGKVDLPNKSFILNDGSKHLQESLNESFEGT